jgi:tetratricopeptide (TPR) repeat protein
MALNDQEAQEQQSPTKIEQRAGDSATLIGQVFGNVVFQLVSPTAALAIIAALAIAAAGSFYVYRTAQKPTVLTGDFNIAVAEFGALDAQGRVGESADAYALAQSVYGHLDGELKSLTEGIEPAGDKFDIPVLEPSKTGRISGSTREQRAQSAERLAGKFKADLIVYGNLGFGDGMTRFIPEFYLSDRKLRDAEELVGQYEFGVPLEIPADITENPVARVELRKQLLERTHALAQFAIGLGYYSLARFDEAAGYFLKATEVTTTQAIPAEETKECHHRDGNEVFYHFLGNTKLMLGDLSAAQKYYACALELNPEYARARLGMAEVLFHESRGDCEQGKVDVVGLQDAIRGYQSALEARDQPAHSDIQTKTAFALGRAYVCLSQSLVANHWADAEREFLTVIADFENGNERVRELAAEAHGQLGLVYLPAVGDPETNSNFRRSAEEYHKAIELSRQPDRQATYYLWLAWIHIRMNECDLADEALAEANKLYAGSTRLNPEYEAFRLAVEEIRSSCQ